jgi:hypothetical protein
MKEKGGGSGAHGCAGLGADARLMFSNRLELPFMAMKDIFVIFCAFSSLRLSWDGDVKKQRCSRQP